MDTFRHTPLDLSKGDTAVKWHLGRQIGVSDRNNLAGDGVRSMAAREQGRRGGAWPLVAWLLVVSLGTPGRVAGGDAILSNYRAFDSERAWNHVGKAAVHAPRRAEAEAELATAAGRASAVVGEPGHKGKASRMTLMLDLDKTCLFGNDGNDMGLCLQYMGKSREVVQELYDRIINPNLRKTYDNYATKTQHAVDVVIYTRRPRLLEYTSCLNGNVTPLRYPDVWHDGTQLYIPPCMRTAEEVRAQVSTEHEWQDAQRAREYREPRE